MADRAEGSDEAVWADDDSGDDEGEEEDAGDRARLIDWGAALILIGGVLAVLASFLPWITATVALYGTITRNGFDGGGDGIITMAVGIAVGLLSVALLTGTGNSLLLQMGAVICAAVLGGVAWVDINSVTERVQQIAATDVAIGSVGAGLIVTALAAVLIVIGAVLSTRTSVTP